MKPAAILTLIALVLIGAPISAQIDTCPAMVQAALTATNDACQDTGRNQACYGNVRLQATPQSDVCKFTFQQQGDKVEVASIKTLKLSSFDAKKGEWGVVLMRLQANLPDTLPGQNVTLVLFGNVEIKDAVPDQSNLKPLQAFYFQSGVGDAPCADAPSSGILIQTPKGAGKVNLTVNGADIALGSTAYLQAQPGKAMTIALVEGQADVTALSSTESVPTGMVVSVPIDTSLNVSGAPTTPQPYSDQQVQALPVSLLERPITVASPQTVQTTATPTVCTVSADKSVNLRSGPGTNYPKAGSLASGENATPNGQAKDTAGITWWQLPGGTWVRSDVVETKGNCSGLPVVVDIPPTPPPAPTQVSGPPLSGSRGTRHYLINFCSGTSDGTPIRAGETVTFAVGCCGAATIEEQQSRQDAVGAPWITLDGASLPIYITGIFFSPAGWYTNDGRYNWSATAGTHTVSGGWGPNADTCTFTVE